MPEMDLLAWLALACLPFSALPFLVFVGNLRAYRVPPPAPLHLPSVSILIPARDEEKAIGQAIDSALGASEGGASAIAWRRSRWWCWMTVPPTTRGRSFWAAPGRIPGSDWNRPRPCLPVGAASSMRAMYWPAAPGATCCFFRMPMCAWNRVPSAGLRLF